MPSLNSTMKIAVGSAIGVMIAGGILYALRGNDFVDMIHKGFDG